MTNAHFFHRSRATGVVMGLAVAILTTLPAVASPVSNLAGRWTGWGAVTLTSGATERVKCVATYFVKNKERDVRQNLRCASPNYKIDTAAQYKIKGNVVTGTWEERSHSNTGNVTGKITGKGFNLSVAADTFSAKIKVTTGACKQSISLVPTNLDVTRISIGLRKC